MVVTGTGGDDEINIIYHDTLLCWKAVDITHSGFAFNFTTGFLFSTKFFGKNPYN